MNLETIFFAVLLIPVLMIAGKFIRRNIPWLQRLFLPSSIVAGALALLLGPQGIGRLFDEASAWSHGLWPEDVLTVWTSLPGLLIDVVFASLFLGKSIPGIRLIWKSAGPMVVHGQTLAWGQYVVGLALVVFLLTPVWEMNPMAGALIEIGFEGGHGTAAGLADTFRELGFSDGADLALGLATIGVVMGVLLGTVAINWAVWKGHISKPQEVDTNKNGEDLAEHENREEVVETHYQDKSIEPLSIHLGLIGVAIGLGWGLQEGLIWIERVALIPLGWPELMTHIPRFPLAMIGGVLVQMLGGKLGYARLVDRKLMNRVSGTSLDLLIVAALASLSLEAIGAHAIPFLLLAAGGVLWNLFGFFVLAPRIFRKDWVPNGLANFGQGMGMTVVGLLLIRMSDPHGRSDAMEAFGYKQLLFEPIVGGGLFTAASVPLIAEFGAWPVLIGTTIVMASWLGLGLWKFGPES